MRILSVASEVYPLIKTGGLADVAGALPPALTRRGVEVRTLLPGYPAVLAGIDNGEPVHRFIDLQGGPARLLFARAGSLDLAVLEAAHLFGRPGNPYLDAGGRDWPDNAQRFAALAQAAAALGRGAVAGFTPDVVHAHDWQAGLTPAYLLYAGTRRPGTVITVHNLAFQGIFPAELLGTLGLPPRAFALEGVEYHGGIGFLKGGLRLADRITTVSPTYAAEIRTPEAGMGLDGLLRFRSDALTGILNGIDDAIWDPSADPDLERRFTARSVNRRRANKRKLQDRFGLSPGAHPMLFGVISRLSWQKGLDLLLEALPRLLELDAQLVVLGAGDPGLERSFRDAAAAHPGRIGVMVGYDEALAHLVQGGSDALLVPSRFEPCGLTQLCAMRYGSVPIVSRVGGLNDTVIDANEMALAAEVATGFQFASLTRDGLTAAIGRAGSIWKNRKAWRRMQANGMAADLGWDRPAAGYMEVYRSAAAAQRKGLGRRRAGRLGSRPLENASSP